MMVEELKIGCCGFPVSREKYFSQFKLVEIQQTFYRLPREETARKWRTSAPADFEFTMKAYQGITHLATSPTYRKVKNQIPEEKKKFYGHFQPTDEVFRAWEETLRIARVLEATVIVLQCPPNFRENDRSIRNLEQFFGNITRDRCKIALELRAEWKRETVADICRRFHLIHCTDPFREEVLYGETRYYRLHGSPPGEKMYRYRYREEDFRSLSKKIDPDLKQVEEVYLLFNNLSMWDDARAFREFWLNRNQEQTK